MVWPWLSCPRTHTGLCCAGSGTLDIFSSCEDQRSEIIEHQERLLWLFFIVSAPSNCSAVGVLVALDFSLTVCIQSQLSAGRNAFVDSSPQMVSGRWLLWRMVSSQQRKVQSLSSSTLSSSKGRHIYWKTSSARYSLSTYLLHLVMRSNLSGARMGVSNTASKYRGNQGNSLTMPGWCLAGPPCASA